MSRRRTTDRHILADDQALDQISKEAEEKLQKRRQERAAARETRLKELERQQREEEARENENQEQTENPKGSSSYTGTGYRRGSDASSESDVSSTYSQDPKDHIRELKHQLRDFEEKYKQAMVSNAQLDNTITTQMFHLELLKEEIEEKDESITECQREYKSKSREFELLKRDYKNLQNDCDALKEQMAVKDKLLQDSGLVIVSSEEGVLSLSKCSDLSDISVSPSGATLISQESADILNKAGEGTLGKSNQVIVTASGSTNNIVDSVDSGVEREDKPLVVTDQTSEPMHANVKDKKSVGVLEFKEQTISEVPDDSIDKGKTADVIDVNSNDVNSVSPVDKENISKVDNTDTESATVDSGIKIEVDLLTDSENTEKLENTETHGLSKSMIAKLSKMSDTPDYQQGLCTSISFESDVTYHRESEDELDNDETDSIDKSDKQKNKRIPLMEETHKTESEEMSSEIESPTAKVRFRIGEGMVEENADLEKRFGPITGNCMDELRLRAYGKAADMMPVESMDDVSSMLVDYDPNENVSIGDVTEDRFEELESSPDSGDDESDLKRPKIDMDSVDTCSSTVRKVFDEFADALPGSYTYMKEVDENIDEKGSMIVCYDPNETASVGDITDSRLREFGSNLNGSDEESEMKARPNLANSDTVERPTKKIGTDELVDPLPGHYARIKDIDGNPSECMDDEGSMVVCYDPNETVSVGDFTDSRLGEFESNVNSSDEESEQTADAEEGLSETPKVLSLADRPGLLGVPGIRDTNRFQSYDDVSSMMVEYDQSETVSVSDVTDMFENVDNSEMTVDNVRRKDYVPGNLNTIGNWVRNVSREEADIVIQQNGGDGNESQSENYNSEDVEKKNEATETDLDSFAKKYVTEIIQDAAHIVCGASAGDFTESHPHLENDTRIISGEPLNISTPSKKDISEDVLPLRRPSDRSSVDILSPITHITEQEKEENIDYFSYKLQTQASVVLSSTGKSDSGEVILEERDEAMSPVLSEISGYGVCLSGDGLQEMEQYYKEMTALSEAERKEGLTSGGDMNWTAEAADQIQLAASPKEDEVFFDAEEKHEGQTTEEKAQKPTDENKSDLPLGETALVEDPDSKAHQDSGIDSIIDDWAKKDYETAAGHETEFLEKDTAKLTDETKDIQSSTDTLDKDPEKQPYESRESLSETGAVKERTSSGSPDSGKRKKSKKLGKDKTERKGSSAEAKSSGSDVDKRLSGSDVDKHGKHGVHSKKKKDQKDENCSLS